MRARALAALFLLLAPVVRADAPAPATEKPAQAYGEDHPACREWTDGCFVCARQADGAIACSTVGAACLPAAVACSRSSD
jgi:hypothetical protein